MRRRSYTKVMRTFSKPFLAALPLILLSVGCFPRAAVPEAERQRTERELTGQKRYLRVAMWTGPFFGASGRMLLSDQPFEELHLLESPTGKTIHPPPPEKVFPPGTQVRIRNIEFPTGWLIAQRPVMTPRYHPWVHVEVAFDDRPFVIVLPQTAASYEDVQGEIDRLLTLSDPTQALRELPPAQREGVYRKELVDGMGVEAVEMAWGLPERKRIDKPARTEEWIWAEGKRRAVFQEEKLVRWEPK
jgi:hypothetical protein